MGRALVPAIVAWLMVASVSSGQSREQKVLADRKKVEAEGFWIYNDLPKGIAEAKRTGKPMLVVLRCIPCEECVKLDDELIDQNKHVRPLLQKFVCVRIVSTNGLDLALFQFDYDQSFAAFMLNADGAVYGRFGTRSHRTSWSGDVSIEGLAKALEGALELHAEYPKNKQLLAAKRGPAPPVASPEKYPSLRDKYGPKLSEKGNVVQSCIHCHQIGDAQRQWSRERKEPISEQTLFSYPHPKTLGLILDPQQRATVKEVEPNSLAERAGFVKGDAILWLDGQPLLSIADVQWVLHRASPRGGTLVAKVRRGDRTIELALELPNGWRRREDISWRVSTWELRRMTLGGLVLDSASAEERKTAGLADSDMALRVRHVGQYGAHAAAKNAGFRQGDLVVAFDEQTNLSRETDLIAYAVNHRKPGDRVAVTVVRDGKKLNLTLPIQ